MTGVGEASYLSILPNPPYISREFPVYSTYFTGTLHVQYMYDWKRVSGDVSCLLSVTQKNGTFLLLGYIKSNSYGVCFSAVNRGMAIESCFNFLVCWVKIPGENRYEWYWDVGMAVAESLVQGSRPSADG